MGDVRTELVQGKIGTWREMGIRVREMVEGEMWERLMMEAERRESEI